MERYSKLEASENSEDLSQGCDIGKLFKREVLERESMYGKFRKLARASKIRHNLYHTLCNFYANVTALEIMHPNVRCLPTLLLCVI